MELHILLVDQTTKDTFEAQRAQCPLVEPSENTDIHAYSGSHTVELIIPTNCITMKFYSELNRLIVGYAPFGPERMIL